eukprot:TRINITY_DN1251_c0_g1_i3.p1 TRINITY_DN1251_c0_g1~~TRINITY_DN1251_c0_g1_i3.p1  ORF type:complete len:363 (-),score=58.03 TRINITY_DN1251_c0_g1_i3:677-1765(-)
MLKPNQNQELLRPSENIIVAQKSLRKWENLAQLVAPIRSTIYQAYLQQPLVLICRELDKIDSGFGTAFNVQSSLGLHPIMAFGTKEQKDKYVPGIVSGQIITCFGLTEPNAGSDVDQMETKAKPDGDDYIINGQKTWISNASVADIYIIWARDEKKAFRGFIVEKGMKGVSTQKIEGKLSLCASDTAFINLDNVRVPKSQMLNVKGLKGPLDTLNMGRYCCMWSSMGAADACYNVARQYSIDRKQFGTPLASFQLIQKKLADMATEISLGTLAAFQIGRLRDKNLASPEMISMLKANNVSKALNIARVARDVLGGNGIVDEYGIFRHLVNLETVNTYEGACDINTLIVGRAVTGINAFTRKL